MLYRLMINLYTLIVQLQGDSPVADSTFVRFNYGRYSDFDVSILVRLIKTLKVIVIGTARNPCDFDERRDFVFLP